MASMGGRLLCDHAHATLMSEKRVAGTEAGPQFHVEAVRLLQKV